ncbi:MAG: 50S ribosomal protein L23 [Candidatus Melainabacteria bacterium RIFCSPHIGHO2_02_FULL_34_12]|nr:MAG: 50S ribosomal protein L23 [Candidatus Melainabacteria bacterium RIFCSPHIGHO2_02_FULL_34_12]
MAKNISDIIIKPLITEKSTALSQFNKYTFEVAKDASKSAIKNAFEVIFPDRKIKGIQTIKIKGHRRRTKAGYKLPIDSKKAVLTIEGPRIEYFPEVS